MHGDERPPSHLERRVTRHGPHPPTGGGQGKEEEVDARPEEEGEEDADPQREGPGEEGLWRAAPAEGWRWIGMGWAWAWAVS